MLRIPQVLASGTLVNVTLHVRTGDFMTEGTVTWVAPLEGRTRGGPIRHGVQFSTLDWSTASLLGRLLAEGA